MARRDCGRPGTRRPAGSSRSSRLSGSPPASRAFSNTWGPAMTDHTRRCFLADVGKGVLAATLGPAVATHFGLPQTFADEGNQELTFGNLEPLVALIEETPDDRILPALVDRLRKGANLRELVAAGALASARTKANAEYSGMHAFLALAPSYAMAVQSPEGRQALPVLKVLARNSGCIHD